MKKICIFNIKGGVGKTTTAVNLAAGLARKGKKVLLLDMDAQGSVSSCLAAEESVKDMYHLIANGAQLKECLTHMGENLDCVTANEALNTVDLEMADRANRDFILQNKLDGLKGYDFVIMDCPPHFGTLTRNALFFSDEVHIPVSTDTLGYSALKKTEALLKDLNEQLRDQELIIGRIIPTMYDRRLRVARSVMKRLQNEYYEILADPIRTNTDLRDAPQKKRSIYMYAKSSTGAKDYMKLVGEVLRGAEEKTSPSDFLEMEHAATEMMHSK